MDAVAAAQPEAFRAGVLGRASQAPVVQVGDGKAEVVIAPDQVALFDREGGEQARVEVGLNQRIARPAEKGLEIDGAHRAIVECEADSELARVLGAF